MKILFETDPHFKELGSMSNESRYSPKYSTRLDHMIASFDWLYSIAREHKVDMIIHGGDILDKPSISAKESHAIEESFAKNTSKIMEFVLVGNHDRKDEHTHALAILANYPTVKIIEKPTRLGKISLLPYTTNYDYDMISQLSSDILFSHVDILGTKFSSTVFSTRGFDPEILKDHFKLVLNGHLHTVAKYGAVHNVGSFFGSGLGDDYELGVPSAILVDTDTLEFTRIPNPHAIHYITINSNDLLEIKTKIEKQLKGTNNFYLRVQCLNEVKSEVRLMVNKYMQENQKILSSIVIGTVRQSKHSNVLSEVKSSLQMSSDPIEILLKFIKTVDDKKLPASRKEIEDLILDQYGLGGTNESI